jgi:hypothetical protein
VGFTGFEGNLISVLMLTIIVDRLEYFDQRFFPFALKAGKYVKHLIYYDLKIEGNDQEVEFHEIKIHFFMRSKLFLIMRSNFFSLFMRLKFLIMNILQKQSGDQIGPRGPRGSLLQVVFSNLT